MSGFFDWLDNAPVIVFGLLLLAQSIAFLTIIWLVEYFQERR